MTRLAPRRRSPLRIRLWNLCIVISVCVFATPARAELALFLQDTTISQGGYAAVNIWLASDSPVTDLFNNYSFELQITGPNVLQFAPNPFQPSDATLQTQNYGYLNSANYIFAGDSLNGLTDSNAGVIPGNQNSQQFVGFDQSLSTSNYAPGGTGPGGTLLASVVLYAFDTNVGDTYSISLVAGANTVFNQIDPNTSLPIPGTDLNYSTPSMDGYAGLVTVGASAVPEPPSILSAIGALCCGVILWAVRNLLRATGCRVHQLGTAPAATPCGLDCRNSGVGRTMIERGRRV